MNRRDGLTLSTPTESLADSGILEHQGEIIEHLPGLSHDKQVIENLETVTFSGSPLGSHAVQSHSADRSSVPV
jgi:hypothetical protein